MKSQTIKFNTARQSTRNSTYSALSMRNSVLILLLLASVGVSSKVQAVSAPPDGGYPGGNSALFSNTTGEGNTAIGQAALSINTTGVANVAVGAGALAANTNSASNTAVGTNALIANTTGIENTAVGDEALVDNNGN